MHLNFLHSSRSCSSQRYGGTCGRCSSSSRSSQLVDVNIEMMNQENSTHSHAICSRLEKFNLSFRNFWTTFVAFTKTHVHNKVNKDQIGRNISILARFQKSLAIFVSLFCIWQNVKPTLVKFYALGKISFMTMANYWINNAAIWSHW